MKKFIMISIAIVALFALFGCSYREHDNMQSSSRGYGNEQQAIPTVSIAPDSLGFSSLEDFLNSYIAVKNGGLARGDLDFPGEWSPSRYDVSDVIESVEFAYLETLYLPIGIPEDFRLLRMSVTDCSVLIVFLHKDDMKLEETARNAIPSERRLIFSYSRWDSAPADLLDAMLRQSFVSFGVNATEDDLLNGRYFFNGRDSFTWIHDRERFTLRMPTQIDIGMETTVNEHGQTVFSNPADMVMFLEIRTVDLTDPEQIQALLDELGGSTPPLTPITSAAINVTAPVAGELQDPVAIVLGSFTADEVIWVAADEGFTRFSWDFGPPDDLTPIPFLCHMCRMPAQQCVCDEHLEPNPYIFTMGTSYIAMVTLTANSGYTFSGLEYATINNNLAIVVNNDRYTATIFYQFPATDTYISANSSAELRAAINIVPEHVPVTIKIADSFNVLGHTIVIPQNRDITIVSNNGTPRVITQTGRFERHFAIRQGASLTLGNGVTLSGGAENNTNISGGVSVDAGGMLTMLDGSVIENCRRMCNNHHGLNGGAVEIRGSTYSFGTFDMQGGMIQNNSVSWGNGGGVHISNGTFTMSGGTIQSNFTSMFIGGGVYIASGTFLMSGGTIQNNGAPTSVGGGVHVAGGVFTMTDGMINNNAAGVRGGGINHAGGEVNIIAGSIINNTARHGNGGGIFTAVPENLTIGANAIISGNTPNDKGS